MSGRKNDGVKMTAQRATSDPRKNWMTFDDGTLERYLLAPEEARITTKTSDGSSKPVTLEKTKYTWLLLWREPDDNCHRLVQRKRGVVRQSLRYADSASAKAAYRRNTIRWQRAVLINPDSRG